MCIVAVNSNDKSFSLLASSSTQSPIGVASLSKCCFISATSKERVNCILKFFKEDHVPTDGCDYPSSHLYMIHVNHTAEVDKEFFHKTCDSYRKEIKKYFECVVEQKCYTKGGESETGVVLRYSVFPNRVEIFENNNKLIFDIVTADPFILYPDNEQGLMQLMVGMASSNGWSDSLEGETS